MTEVYERRWYADVRIDKPTGEWLEAERRRVDAALADIFSRHPINGPPKPRPPPQHQPVDISEEASYEQWIGLLYACAVFRGVLVHPPPWPGPIKPVGYVVRVGP